MSDNNPSDAAPLPAPVETSAAPASAVSIDGFGASRGTGLARGKRPARPVSTPTGSAPVAGYQPTAIQVVVTKTEYVNPFASDPEITPAASPAPVVAAPEPVADVVLEAAPAPVAEVAPAPVAFAPAPVVEKPAPAAKVFVPEPKAELNILPPAAPRPVTSWESPGAAASAPANATPAGERPVFRVERKPIVAREITPLRPVEARSYEGRPSGEQPRREGGRRGDDRRREGGEQPRRDERRDGPRPAGQAQAPASPAHQKPAAKPAPEKAGGFVGWLKNIFGGATDAPAAAPAPGGERAPRPEGPGGPDGQGRREGGGRRRGGRGRGRSGGGGGFQGQPGGENRGPRPEGQAPAPGGQGQPRPEGQRGPRPEGQGGQGGGQRRHHGGGGGGGDRVRGPRPEGQGQGRGPRPESGPRPSGGDSRPAA